MRKVIGTLIKFAIFGLFLLIVIGCGYRDAESVVTQLRHSGYELQDIQNRFNDDTFLYCQSSVPEIPNEFISHAECFVTDNFPSGIDRPLYFKITVFPWGFWKDNAEQICKKAYGECGRLMNEELQRRYERIIRKGPEHMKLTYGAESLEPPVKSRNIYKDNVFIYIQGYGVDLTEDELERFTKVILDDL
tara:strand:+ start:88 stop:657 length:570 start_codon:yes stop_codon:yes gene_type:complete